MTMVGQKTFGVGYEKAIILGTGYAMVTKCYNTCFTLSNGGEHFLVDAGGGNTILSNLEKSGIPINKIHNMFISHAHADHLLGAPWIIRAVIEATIGNRYEGNLNIYCHSTIQNAITTICDFLYVRKFMEIFNKRIVFHQIFDKHEVVILGRKTIFLDNRSEKDLQYCFVTELLNGKKLTFLGDEPYKEHMEKYVINSDYMCHEAFCLYSQRDLFKPYEKYHATAMDACVTAQKLNVGTIILYHMDDLNLADRKRLYTEEGRTVFEGKIYVPYDLDVIEL